MPDDSSFDLKKVQDGGSHPLHLINHLEPGNNLSYGMPAALVKAKAMEVAALGAVLEEETMVVNRVL